jgi:hypothetical protein
VSGGIVFDLWVVGAVGAAILLDRLAGWVFYGRKKPWWRA